MAQHDKKRKRESDIKNETQVSGNNNFSMPTSSLDVGIMHASKKMKREETSQEWKVKNNNSEVIQSIRARKKNEKKTNHQMLKSQGMLPSVKFDYKSVDFSSFQGGSATSSASQTQFQQPRQKKDRGLQKRKKQKFNI